MNYYYKVERGLLNAKHELSEEELGDWVAITEEEYLSLKAAHETQRKKKVESSEEGDSNA